MSKRLTVVVSESNAAEFNLAFESYLFSRCERDEFILYLWKNDRTVVIGRNQNVQVECNIERCIHDNITVIRRDTGGGAVYQDLGNLCFTFICHNTDTQVSSNYELVTNALQSLGIDARVNGRNDITVADRKISGNAFKIERGMLCHHGTLLINMDSEGINKYLNISKKKIISKKVLSNVSRVTNIMEVNHNVTEESIIEALIYEARKYYEQTSPITYVDGEFPLSTTFSDRFENIDLMKESKLIYDFSLEEKFSWGLMRCYLWVENSTIVKCIVSCDSLEYYDFSLLEELLVGCSLQAVAVIENLTKYYSQSKIRAEMSEGITRLFMQSGMLRS